jgi:GT2 family glycosyltransferase
MNKVSIDLSIIIVSYNTKDLLQDCLNSIFNSDLKPYVFEVIVYDNASTDGSVSLIKSKFPMVQIILGDKNVGFAAGNNQAIVKSSGKYLLLLNSDTILKPDTLKKMLEFMEKNKDIGVSTCKLILANGFLDPACHRGFPTPWAAITYLLKLEKLFPKSEIFGQYHMGFKGFDSVHEIDSPSGAFYLIRRKVIEDVGLLDEDYFMYGEDLDWSYRIKQKGYKIIFNPSAQCLHLKKQSGRNNTDHKKKIQSDIYFHQNNWLFYRKHFNQKYGIILYFLIKNIYSFRIFLLKYFSI